MEEPRPTMSNRPVYSCIKCSDRKVKCDRQNPCSSCVRHKYECIFRPVRTPQRKQKQLKRVQHNEVQGLKSDVISQGDDSPQSHHQPRQGKTQAEPGTRLLTPSSIASRPGTYSSTPVLSARGRTQFIDNSLMTRVAEEIDTNEGSPYSLHQASDEEEVEDGFDLVLGVPLHHHSGYMHPPSSRVYELLQVFAENVDPLTKIIHVPSLRAALQGVISNMNDIPRSFNALMFAIYSTAILSLNEEECQSRFAEPRHILLSRYVTATKVALARANFTSSTNIVILQALMLHILAVRENHDPRSIWIWTGVAMRIAEGMGLHHDAESLGFAPFEAEMRRRIWYYIKMHDGSAAELCGQPKFKGRDTDTNVVRVLANVNDNDMYPGMTSLPPESSKPTDMIFYAVKSEFLAFAERMAAINRKNSGLDFLADDFASKNSTMPNDEVTQNMEDRIETKYLRYCDPSNPLQLMAILFARHSMNVCRFMAHHPRKWKSREHMPESERDFVWKVSIKLLEQLDMLQSSHHLQRFAWMSAYYLKWYPFIHVLDTLRSDPLVPDATKAWRLVEATFRNNPTIIANTKRALHVAVGHLCLKAFRACETATGNDNSLTSHIPDFIHRLREGIESTNIQAQVRPSSSQKKAGVPEYSSHDAMMSPSRDGHNRSIPTEPAQLEASVQAFHLDRSNAGSFWLGDDFGSTAGLGVSKSLMDPNTDFMLAGEQGTDDTTVHDIDWEQWDAWLDGVEFQNAGGL